MKVPQMPVDMYEYIGTVDKLEDGKKYLLRVLKNASKVVDTKGRYAHWDKLQYRPTPEGVDSPLEYWHSLKLARRIAKKETVFNDKNGDKFQIGRASCRERVFRAV